VLVGREAECESIDALLNGARSGVSRALVLRGEPGIGKSALLHYAETEAVGWRILRAAGTESEAELPFAGLDQLLRPIRGHVGQIPKAQAQALEVALALGAPAPADRFTAAVATLSLLAAAAEEGPVLCLLDDAHWLDTSSADALVFACRRFQAEKIAVLFAAREGEQRQFEAPDLPDLRLSGVGEPAARSIVAASRVAMAGDAITKVIELAQGNPLALLELPSTLSAGQRVGEDALPERLPVTASVERAFLGRARTLPPETQQALTLAAASDSDELKILLRAIESLGLPADVLLPAESAGLLVIQKGRFAFRHPLVRSALYQAADAAARRKAHGALAESLIAPEQRARRAWHLAEATMVADEAVATELDAAGNESRLRGAYATAASAFERAAQLSDDDDQRAGRLLAAVQMLWIAGQVTRAAAVVEEALHAARDPALRADIELARGRMSTWSGHAPDASKRLRTAAEAVMSVDRSRAALLMAEAVVPTMMAGDILMAETIAVRAMELAEPIGGLPSAFASLGLGQVLALRGESTKSRQLLQGVRAALDKSDPFGPGAILTQIAHCYIWLEEYRDAHEILESVISAARTRGAVVVLPFALGVLSDYEFRVGNFAAAYAAATESVQLAHQTGQAATAAFGYVSLARSEAVFGRIDECRAHAEHALELARRAGSLSVHVYANSAVGLLDLSLGRPAAALDSLVRAARIALDHGLEEPATVQWGPDLIQAYVELGSLTEAEAALAAFETRAQRTGRTWALATAARCRGLLASERSFAGEFEKALALHDRTPTPFERARTELSYGQRLRRAGLRRKSRDLLHVAYATFERLGAEPWTRRAAAELRATGERVRPPKNSTDEQLTAQELQVALIVAEGATNREVAAQLFLSPKTIEFHLSHIFRKLGLRSRTELARRLARGNTGTP
jgi:DNA-binding CsgD family transcriptional regulator/tetratricopeptide (TPR) repeat protein